jgi:hypothetical protein
MPKHNVAIKPRKIFLVWISKKTQENLFRGNEEGGFLRIRASVACWGADSGDAL